MGYTHYFKVSDEHNLAIIDPSEDTKDRIGIVMGEIRTIVQHHFGILDNVIFRSGETYDETPLIRFEGIGDQAHETFLFDFGDLDNFAFCKTARKEYDIVVCLVLISIGRYLGEFVEIGSDGFPYNTEDDTDMANAEEGWIEAMHQYFELFPDTADALMVAKLNSDKQLAIKHNSRNWEEAC